MTGKGSEARISLAFPSNILATKSCKQYDPSALFARSLIRDDATFRGILHFNGFRPVAVPNEHAVLHYRTATVRERAFGAEFTARGRVLSIRPTAPAIQCPRTVRYQVVLVWVDLRRTFRTYVGALKAGAVGRNESSQLNAVRRKGIDEDIRLKTLERVFVSTAWFLYPSLKRWVRWKN